MSCPTFVSPAFLLAGELANTGEPWRSHPVPQPDGTPLPRRQRVLVAEDDPVVRTMLQRLLRDAGFEVRTAKHGDEALGMALRASGEFDLVVTDVRMPVMDGLELARRLQERWPGLPVLYISGYDVELSSGSRRGGTRQALLRKPFDLDELLREVIRLLDLP
ncbi:MAG TPA: response regulator [Gemmatimonadales bacterium]|nr:response regulator [Gemmatimonadales bacterium]